jgi:hypothetical protein
MCLAKMLASFSTLVRRSYSSRMRLRPFMIMQGAETIVVDEGGEGVDERVEIGGRNEQAFNAVADEFGDAGDRSGDARDAHGHGFHENHWKALSEAGQAEEIGLRVDGTDAVLIDCAFEDDAIGEVEAFGLGAEGGFVGAVAGEAQADVVALVEELAKSVDERCWPLAGVRRPTQRISKTPSDLHDNGELRWEWGEEVRIDAEAADVELLPVFVRREVHELAARVGADADDEIGGGNLWAR